MIFASPFALFANGDFFCEQKKSPHPRIISILTHKKKENKKIVAVSLALTLGHFGVHRIYLGTSPQVPPIYTLTLGGGLGLLPLTDIVFLIVSKDISKFENNPRVIMWIKK